VRSTTSPSRGDIVRVKMAPDANGENAGERPALVLSPDIINAHSPMVLVAAITSEKVDRVYPFEVLIQPPEGGLKVSSKILLMHIRSIDKRRLAGIYGEVSPETMQKVGDALMIATGLEPI